jgi:N utilization substance protein B
MKALEQEVESQVNAVEEKQQELDQLINDASTNFDIFRLSKVDLAILRLATWEIKSLPNLDSAISINEAIDLARSFSGDESATFVNGLLDTIAKG